MGDTYCRDITHNDVFGESIRPTKRWQEVVSLSYCKLDGAKKATAPCYI